MTDAGSKPPSNSGTHEIVVDEVFLHAPETITVHAASLDDPSRYKPQMVTYTVRGHAWDHLDPALPKFDKMPPM